MKAKKFKVMKTKNIKNIERNVFAQLLKTDFLIFKNDLLDTIIDFTIWVVASTAVCAYLLPFFGMSKNYVIFQIGATCASTGLFKAYGNAFSLVADLEGAKVISYYLTLPIRSFWVFIEKVLFFAISFAAITLIVLPITKVVIPYKFSILSINFFKFFIILIVSNIFYGTLTLWLVSKVKNIYKMESVWSRFIFPLWFLGGFQFSWHAVNAICKPLSYALLLNPIVYIMEAYRVAILNQQEGYLNFWLCLIVILFFAFLLYLNSFYSLKKKLDFV